MWTRLACFIALSYPIPTPASDEFFPHAQHYVKGPADVRFVIGWAIIFALLREVLMRGVFSPFIRYWIGSGTRRKPSPKPAIEIVGYGNGILASNGEYPSSELKHRGTQNGSGATSNGKTKLAAEATAPVKLNSVELRARRERGQEKKVTRFAEQGWSVFYCSIYWAFGLYIHYNSPVYPFKLDHLWLGYPEKHLSLPGPAKFYYLTQLAFWLNQLFVLNIEARRKDYSQMLAHHVITIALIVGSYMMDYYRVGCLILVLFDLCDIILPFAKMLKYMGLEPLPDIAFGAFLLGWLVTRQGLFTAIVVSVIRDAPRIMPFVDDGVPGAVLTRRAWLTYSTLLSGLAVLMLIWLFMILRVALKVVTGAPAEDTRSDDESEPSEND